MDRISQKNQFLIEPSREKSREFLAKGAFVMNRWGAVAQSVSLFAAILGCRIANPWIATAGFIASLGFRDIHISGRNMERLMINAEERKKVAASSENWELYCARRTLFLTPYIRYKENS